MSDESPGPESMRGEHPYLDILARIHETLAPPLYLEVGIRNGGSLTLAKLEGIGIDPAPDLTQPLAEQVVVHTMTSDDFFRDRAADVITRPIDFAFIDGMHLFDFALRDFINVEKYCAPSSIIVFDDIFPNHPAQATRDRQTRAWTGDIWKIVFCLRTARPDLELMALDSYPTGLLVVSGLDPTNRTLADHYDELVAQWCGEHAPTDPPAEVIERRGVRSLEDLDAVLRLARSRR